MTGPGWWLVLVGLWTAAVALRQPVLFLFAVLLTLGTGASAVWARYCLAGLTYVRRFAATRLDYGGETELTVEIVNAKPLPLAWLRVRDEWPEEVALLTGRLVYSHHPNRRVLPHWLALRWYERVRRVYRLRGAQRGAYTFGPAEAASGDVFGFRWRSATLPAVDTVVVYPKVVPAWEWTLPAGRPLGEILAERRVVDDPLRCAGVRDYVPGDSPRHIHWKNSARWGRLQTRVFDPEASPAVVLIVDVQTSEHGAYWFAPAYLELVICAAASLACQALDERRPVGLYANAHARGQVGAVQVRPGRDPAQRARLLEALARLTSFRQMTCHQLIQDWIGRLPYGATVVTLTSQPTEALQSALLALRAAGHPAVLLTVGEAPVEAPAGLDVRYLGGRDVWQNLA